MMSCIADIVTFIGFAITLWQLFKVKGQIRAAVLQMQKTTKLVSVVDCLRLVDQIQSDLLAKRWDLALLRLSELNKCLIEIREDAQLMRHTQSDFKYRLSSMPSSLSKLRDIVSGADTNADLRFLNRDLQSIQDNLKLIEYHIKK